MQLDPNAPIFVGGTGRSGTSVMGDFLNSHADLVLPVRENKLIVEAHGLRTLINALSDGFDFKSNHYAIADFLKFAVLCRRAGFEDHSVQFAWRVANKLARILAGKTFSPDRASRKFRLGPYGAHPIGDSFGQAHYDACLVALRDALVADIDKDGVFVAEGLLQPVYMAKTFDRNSLLDIARMFLFHLNSVALTASGAQTWCDDTPSNALHAEFLLELYPQAKIIHMVRDPRDVLASFLEQPWVSPNIDRTTLRLSHAYRRLIEVEGAIGSDRFLTLRLEDLCEDFEAKKRGLSAHCGVSPHGFDGSVRFDLGRIGTWREKVAADHHERIARDLGFALDHYGYR